MAPQITESTGSQPPFVDPPLLIRAPGAAGFVRANNAFRALVGYGDAELAAVPFLNWIEPSGQDMLRAALAVRGGSCSVIHRARDGKAVPLDVVVADHPDGVMLLATGVDAPARREATSTASAEATVLGTLDTIARIVEEQNPGYKCSILLVTDGRFVSGAGPSLPKEYNAAIDGFAVGPAVGSCGTAIYWNVPVIAVDIQNDPLWVPFAELARQAGVASCWSHPFTSGNGRVLGALALYGSTPNAPTVEQLGRLRTAARMTGLAVERGRAEEALRKQRERELELEAQLRQAAKMEALGVLAGGVAHDFNNVLATILSNAELARKLVPGESGVASMLSDIVGASQRAGQFCQQMLAYAGRGSRTITKVEVGALFAELHGLVQAALSKKARIEYVMHPVPIYVEGDENQLLQVVMNLITNAAEALGDNEGSVVVRTELVQYDATALQRLDPQADLAAGEYLRLTVRDTGCGMDASTMARVFDPFFTTKFEGRGLGLSAVKGIVATHRGAIQLESRVGEGTTFMVVLPTVGRPNPAVPVTPLGDAPHARMRVLLVDDEAPLRTALARWLRHSGFEVVVAADGEQALALFAADPHAIDCVLLDLSMPKLSGQQVHAQLVAMRPDIPVVIMSGYSEQEVSDRFAGVRLAGTLAKPIAAETLVATLHAAIASTR